ncbi:hypothetical protein ABZP36_013774 [Zizania latifolia]
MSRLLRIKTIKISQQLANHKVTPSVDPKKQRWQAIYILLIAGEQVEIQISTAGQKLKLSTPRHPNKGSLFCRCMNSSPSRASINSLNLHICQKEQIQSGVSLLLVRTQTHNATVISKGPHKQTSLPFKLHS